MKINWERLKNPVVLLSGLMACFSIIVLWIFYFAQSGLLEGVMKDQSQVEGKLVKRTYEIEQLEVKAKEQELNEYLLRQSKQAADEVSTLKRLTETDLQRIIKEFGITGLWIIDEDNKVRIGTSTKDAGQDADGFYSEFIDGDFVYQIEKIRRSVGNSWVSPFKISHHAIPKGYMKYAYTSITNPERPSEVLVVETGASVNSIKAKRYGTDRFVTRHTLPDNIVNVNVDETYRGKKSAFLETKEVEPYVWEVRVLIDDLAGESLMKVELDYNDLRKEQLASLQTTCIASALLIFVFLAVLLTRERQRYSNIVRQELKKIKEGKK